MAANPKHGGTQRETARCGATTACATWTSTTAMTTRGPDPCGANPKIPAPGFLHNF